MLRLGGLLNILWLSGLAGMAFSAEPKRHEYQSRHMGTEFRLILYHDDSNRAAQAARRAFEVVDHWEKILSDYKPDSEIQRLAKQNDLAPGRPIPISRDLATMLRIALAEAEFSAGDFDFTLGPLTRLWRISRRTQEHPPEADLAAARQACGFRLVTLNDKSDPPTVTLSRPGMRLDFGGIGKGFAVDQALATLKDEFGIETVLMAAAGDITCKEAPPGTTGWLVEIAPLRRGGPARKLRLKNASVSTSGDLEQVAVIGGVRYSHLLNPHTGRGLPGQRSVTVIAPTGTQADALTKLASIRPPEEALKLLAQRPGVELYRVTLDPDAANETVTESPGFRRYWDTAPEAGFRSK